MTSTSICEISDVSLAVRKLYELGDRLKRSAITFRDTDIQNIDHVIGALHELELARAEAHQLYETETIKASALRYKLCLYPGEINNEIEEAVKAAHGLNEGTLSLLRNNVQLVHDTMARLENEWETLNAENGAFYPALEAIKLEYERIIAYLNERLSNKAGKQIDLNETRDELRSCNKRIVDLEEDIVQLKQDMIRERAEVRQELKILSEETQVTEGKCRTQRDKNSDLKKILDSLQHEMAENQLKIDGMNKVAREELAVLEELEKTQAKLNNEIEQDILQNTQLTEKGYSIEEDIASMTRDFNAWLEEMQAKLKKIELLTSETNEENVTLRGKQKEVKEELEKALEIREEDSRKVHELQEELSKVEEELALKAGDVGGMQQEIIQMQERMAELTESHEATVVLMQKQLEELRVQLTRERQERQEIQGEKNTLQKEIDEFRTFNAKYMKEKNAKINESKAAHSQLNNEMHQLNSGIKSDTELAGSLRSQINTTREDLERVRTQLTRQRDQLTTELTQMRRLIEEKTGMLTDRTPQFEEFKKHFTKQSEIYEQMKKELVGLKNKKQSLEDSTSRTSRAIDKHQQPLADMNRDVLNKQAAIRHQMGEHAGDRTGIEQTIYVSGCKLRTVREENARLHAGIEQLTRWIGQLRDDWEEAMRDKSRLRQEVTKQHDLLAGGWAEDSQVEADFSLRDRQLMDLIGQLLDRTGQRERLIGEVTGGLESQIFSLTEFLNTVGGRKVARAAPTTRQLDRKQPPIGHLQESISQVQQANQSQPVLMNQEKTHPQS